VDKISVIIPVYNESKALDALFTALTPFKDQCEIIFADGGSNDGTAELIARNGGMVVQSPQKGRANQMNHGAEAATGEILWFLHADSLPPADALSQIKEVLGKGYRIGCFRLRFNSKHPFMLIHALLSNQRVRVLNIAFGDQGIFLQKSLFEELGGYAPIPLMEDYKLSMDARKAGYSIGMATGKIITSARRYQLNGRLRTMWRMQMLQRRFRRGHDIEEIARAYDRKG